MSEGPDTERRHANRVTVEGYVFETEAGAYPVLDLSIGGLRLTFGEGTSPCAPGDGLEGNLTGPGAGPIALTAQVVWVDEDAGQAGCTFPTLGRNIAGDLLEILL